MLVLAFSLLLAQQQPLTLEQAVASAKENAPAFRRLINDADVAAAGVKQSYGALFPAVNANVQMSGFSSSRVTGENDYGQPVKLPQAVDFKGSSAQQGVGLSMKLFDGGAMLREVSAARAQANATDASVYAEQNRLIGEITRQYYNALRASRLVAVEEALLASAKERLDRTEKLLRVVGSSPADLLGARAEVASQEQQVARAQNDAHKQALVLAELMGTDGDVDYQLTSDFPTVVDPAKTSLAQLLEDAARRSPAILQADANARAASKRLGSSRSARMPSISANASYGRSMSLSSYDALTEWNPQNHGFNFGFTASIPVFNNFRPSYAIAVAQAADEDAKQDVRATRLRVERQVRSAYGDLANSYKLLQLAETKASLSRERLDLAQEQYRNGAMTFTELQNVIDRTADAERQVVDARYNYANARAYLDEFAGVTR